jgi:hypothetical protein
MARFAMLVLALIMLKSAECSRLVPQTPMSLPIKFILSHNPGYATPILYARGIVLKTAQRTAFVKIMSNYIKIKMIKKLGEDQIK